MLYSQKVSLIKAIAAAYDKESNETINAINILGGALRNERKRILENTLLDVQNAKPPNTPESIIKALIAGADSDLIITNTATWVTR